ncbi:hypothetical protein [Mycolicibacterium porcinum]|uniref:Uncharacterized protein n=1 Tax=Mycolicibacterium porcinum TaxID=39693 RepID=A0ABV3V6T1_9MYCO
MTEKTRTRAQAAIAGVALTALMGGLLAVDVAQRGTAHVQVPTTDYTQEWEKLKREAVDEGWTQEQLQEAKDAILDDTDRRDDNRECDYGDSAVGTERECKFGDDAFTI